MNPAVEWIEDDPESPYQLDGCDVVRTYAWNAMPGFTFSIARGHRDAQSASRPMFQLMPEGRFSGMPYRSYAEGILECPK